MFTRRHYRAIAERVRAATNADGSFDVDGFIRDLGIYFKRDNPRFDAAKFRAAAQRD
jgi:hypothetical protein